jgi:hypothetical protein
MDLTVIYRMTVSLENWLFDRDVQSYFRITLSRRRRNSQFRMKNALLWSNILQRTVDREASELTSSVLPVIAQVVSISRPSLLTSLTGIL